MSTTLASHPDFTAHDASHTGPEPFAFTVDQQKLIGDLGRKMRVVGGFFVLMGLVRLLYDVLVERAIRLDLTLLIDVLVGLWTISAGRAFHQVTLTRGREIEHLMKGLGDMRKLYLLIFWLLGVAAMVALLLLLSGLFTGELVYRVR